MIIYYLKNRKLVIDILQNYAYIWINKKINNCKMEWL